MESDTTTDFYQKATDIIPFGYGQLGLLGVGTNGAMPQSIKGFHFEAAILSQEDGSIIENYWLKADLNFSPRTVKSETVLFFPDYATFQALCREVVESMTGYHSDLINQPGIAAHRNAAQLAHDLHEDSAPVIGVRIEVKEKLKEHLEMTVFGGRNGKERITSLAGPFTMAEVQALVHRFETMKAYRDETIADIQAEQHTLAALKPALLTGDHDDERHRHFPEDDHHEVVFASNSIPDDLP
jgi:hypothetical protein